MSINRELHELAAKAAGYEVTWHHANQCYMITEGASERRWLPLDDDGDSMRLAADSELVLTWFDDAVCAHGGYTVKQVIFPGVESDVEHDFGMQELFGNDRYAATRRVVFRAATEIGKWK